MTVSALGCAGSSSEEVDDSSSAIIGPPSAAVARARAAEKEAARTARVQRETKMRDVAHARLLSEYAAAADDKVTPLEPSTYACGSLGHEVSAYQWSLTYANFANYKGSLEEGLTEYGHIPSIFILEATTPDGSATLTFYAPGADLGDAPFYGRAGCAKPGALGALKLATCTGVSATGPDPSRCTFER